MRTLAAGLVSLCLTATVAAQEEDERPPEEILGGSAAFDLGVGGEDTVWVDEGSPLFEQPDSASRRLQIIDVVTELEVVDRSGDWYKVRHGTRIGWVLPGLPWKDRVVEITDDLDPLRVTVPGIDATSLGRRALAERLLGTAGADRTLGPYTLLTDVKDSQLLEDLGGIATGLESAYRERYGLELGEPGGQVVALFASERGYREFERSTTESPDARRQGHAIGSLASLHLEHDRAAEERALLIHELTHLMNRRALGAQPPPWIEEGLANDMSYSEVGRSGLIRPGSLAGANDIFGPRYNRQIVFSGGLASLSQVVRARYRRQGTPLADLVAMDQDEFMQPAVRQLHYAEAAFFIRFLLDGPREKWAAALRAYLETVASGAEPSPEELIGSLDATWAEIEGMFDAWLRVQSAHLLR